MLSYHLKAPFTKQKGGRVETGATRPRKCSQTATWGIMFV